jgi:choline dehydrogenase-like flavoprotein
MAILNRVMHTAPLADIIDHTASDQRLGHWLPTANPTELRAYVRSHLETLFHPTSTARMAPLSDGGVVDGQLRVHGVQSLRVVDASIFPTIISGHTVRARSRSLSHLCIPHEAISDGHQPSTWCCFSIATACLVATRLPMVGRSSPSPSFWATSCP